ncbi:TRAP transporter substrate-binding protein [Marinivivus vitaminiproducens]|uniref:TRAP transporter substrate-binding protein n=1 Tax=Marinivivus vitaminiproducens TaxID=3035935 RepID=UPI0027990E4D|nr:TRAP transporter substrate-binding protein [Geminicoccaceae bacterium SCSIO 64248]
MARQTLAILALGAALVGGSVSPASSAEFTMNMGVANPVIPNNFSWTHLEVLEREIEERSGGRIDVTIYPGAQLGGVESVVNQVKDGVVQASDASDGHFATTYPNVQVFSVPYLFRSREVAWRVLDGPVGDKMREEMAATTGLRPLFWTENGGFRHFTSASKELQSVADLSGLKMRVQNHPISMEIARALGMSPTPIAWGELYTALQTGVVDGQENSISTFLVPKLYEVQKHMILDGHIYAVNTVIVNEAWYQGLPDDLKAAIEQAAAVAVQTNRGLSVANEISGRATLEEEGVTVYAPTAEEMDELKKLTQEPAIAWLKSNVDAGLLDEIMAAAQEAEAHFGYR